MPLPSLSLYPSDGLLPSTNDCKEVGAYGGWRTGDKKMIGLSMTTQATGEGAAILIRELPSSRLRDEIARVSRSATLDGGCVIDHQGFSDGDRTFDVRVNLYRNEADILWNFFTTKTYVNISTAEGFFYGVIESMRDENGQVRLSLLVKE